MWLSEKAAERGRGHDSAVGAGLVTIGGNSSAVLLDGEARGLKALSVGGVCWAPEAGRRALVVTDGEGERYVIGLAADENELAPEAGEVYIKSKNASIKLKNNGELYVQGDLHISGRVFVTGALYINGADIAEMLAGGGTNGA